jgi:exo-1,4-beta-D-glucosaminidase
MNEIKLSDWKLCSSEKLNYSGVEISAPNVNLNDWYSAIVPSTVLSTLVENGVYKDPYFGKNLNEIPTDQFQSPWWYRTEFELSAKEVHKIIQVSFDGINYKANIWLNGILISDTKTVNGAFRRYIFNISKAVISGKNILAVEVIPPKAGDFSIGFVDWNPNPPDNNVGIFREVTVHSNSGVSIQNPFVESRVDLESLDSAELKITADLINHKDRPVSGMLKGEIENIEFFKSISLEARENITIEFASEEFLQLNIENPRLWWPNNLGDPNLYKLHLSFIENHEILDTVNTSFGIREVEDYINEGGHRGFKINGHKVLIRGAGWTDDLLLQDIYKSLKAQIEFVKDMNLNCIRLEGFWGKDHKLYDLCDENGILIMVGWSCHWEHEEYLGKPIDVRYGGVIEPDEIELISQSWEDQLLWLRNHPAIFVWTVGSDMLPHPDLEQRYIDTFKKYDNTRPYLNSTGGVGSEQGIITSTEIISEISGSSRVKMLGPYAYTPPIYWFTNKNLGGAYGFNTETCPGANVPPIESIKKMIPENHLWPIDDYWNFHCGKNSFSHIDRIQVAIEKRYGKATGVEDFAQKNQMLNYELMRPMFEAFQANKKNATGIIQWMLNSAWPELYWQLYDTYLRANGAYYGAKKANEPIHLLYNYGDNSIYKVNDTFENIEKYRAQIRILDINSKIIYKNEIDLDIEAESSSILLTLPTIPNLTKTYFLDLRIIDNSDVEVGNNFYWLSTKEDVLDYEAEFDDWAFHTPSKEYSDFSLINSLPKVKLNMFSQFETDEGKTKVITTLENNNESMAFFVELLLHDKNNELILPVIWSDNYISLLPGEKRNIEAYYYNEKLVINESEVSIKGWNLIL